MPLAQCDTTTHTHTSECLNEKTDTIKCWQGYGAAITHTFLWEGKLIWPL